MNSKILSRLILTFIALNFFQSPDSAALESFDATYKIHKGLLKVGSIKRTLEIDKSGRYVFKSLMESSGLVKFLSGSKLSETSEGKISDKQVTPESYIRDTDKNKRNYTLNFDREINVVRRTDITSGYEAKLMSDTYDKLSYQAQMMLELDRISKDGLIYKIASQKKIVEYKISLLGEKEITSPVGTFDTIVVNRKDPDSKKETTVYCAEELGWLPVKIKHTDKKGRSMTALLESLVTASRDKFN